jgi:RNA polymerase sigma-70 factor, ECF subfamily
MTASAVRYDVGPVTDAPREELLHRLRTPGRGHDAAVRELHAMLLRAARFELGRRRAALAHVRGEELDDLAVQAADDALVAVLAKLDSFRGESRFSTWAYKFALYEAAVRARRRAWQHREVVLDEEAWRGVGDHAAGPAGRLDQAELLRAVTGLIETCLSPRQREVLLALAIQGVPIDVLAERTASTRGALYKVLHDARRKLRAELSAAGYDLEGIAT